jgi:hypothetical protein
VGVNASNVAAAVNFVDVAEIQQAGNERARARPQTADGPYREIIIELVCSASSAEFTGRPTTGFHGDLASGTVSLRNAVNLRPTHSRT